jgi:hypothetical protein
MKIRAALMAITMVLGVFGTSFSVSSPAVAQRHGPEFGPRPGSGPGFHRGPPGPAHFGGPGRFDRRYARGYRGYGRHRNDGGYRTYRGYRGYRGHRNDREYRGHNGYRRNYYRRR